ncbi:MAG: NAD(P)H-dependent dehydrogenase/reductase [Planctomycetes bacterium]|nr:NAD(P)H-dependent dehydrogenase/reductase [Planctomycetota bacterium]
MDMTELLRTRRSIRRFLDRPIEANKVELLKEAAIRSPTSRNLEPWEFTFVEDRETLRKLSACKPHGAAFLAGAALGVVVCADSTKSDVWIEDCSVASILLQMAAQSLGLGSCWIQVRQRMYEGQVTSVQYVQSLLELPEHVQVASIIGMGYPAEQREPKASDHLNWARVS